MTLTNTILATFENHAELSNKGLYEHLMNVGAIEQSQLGKTCNIKRINQ